MRGAKLYLISSAATPLAPLNSAPLGCPHGCLRYRASFHFVLAAGVRMHAEWFRGRQRKKPTPAKKQQPAPAPAIVGIPPVELTLEQKPAVPPTVTYQDKQLTIVAENLTWGMCCARSKANRSVDRSPANTNARVAPILDQGHRGCSRAPVERNSVQLCFAGHRQ